MRDGRKQVVTERQEMRKERRAAAEEEEDKEEENESKGDGIWECLRWATRVVFVAVQEE
jgi:hypothetical protein